MADKNTVKITVPVEFQAELNSLKKIESSLKETLNKTNPGSALAKELTASLTKLRPMIAEYEKLSISPEIDMTGINRMQTLFQSIMREFEKTTSRMEFAPLENILPQEALNRINQLKTELAELQKQYTNIEKHGSTEQATAYLTRTNKEDIIAAARKTGKYRGEATLGQNVDIFAKEIENSKTNAAILTDKAMALGEQYQQLENDLKTAKATLQEKWIAQARTQKAADQAAFYSGIGGFDIRYNSKTGERPTSGSLLTGQLEKMLRSSEFSDSGYLKGNMQSLMVQMLKDMNFDETEATAISKMQLDPMISAIRQHFSVTIDELNEAMPVAMMQAFEQAKGKASSRLAELKRQTEEQGITDINAANAKAHQAYKNQEKEVNKLKGETDAAFTKYEAAEYAADEANKATAAFESLHAALAAVAKEAQEAALALKKEEKEKKESEVERAQTEEREKVQKPTKTSGVDPDAGRDNMAAGRDTANYQLNQKSQQQLEAEQFTANLKQSIKQWMSASQIINLVKNGIRQAYQDIQGLDKAMTNIAVVTDMSIGDLWGKINEYMTVAQQYGVSTQGVYEVSQLYYQQGLGTADVMAATTETLKMARIAGMDYADAADAMTVAIRSFKMEMSDAAHVTDVYSKVAAITASDSEELAIAMSKTASSAESVGSSFENTTAMLAVMIETTRESAQNLGSALKSIISRYGEMKVGATVDADGEALDYNKVDTALKSIGISIKDAQGQFRDFDDVIFELSSKWDSLDSVTQRYIATIMAGNRQQSRFIALVDNWERLDEVSGAAQNSDDAGLVQYAKTLDSLESKLNNIKTSFQEFYMSIVNGPVVSAALDFINNLLQGLNQLGSLQGILNIASLIAGLKTGLSLLGNLFANSFSSIVANWKAGQEKMVSLAFKYGRDEHKAKIAGYNSIDENGQQKLGAGQNQQAPTTKNGKKPADTLWGEDQSYSFGVRNEKSGKVGKLFQYKNEKHALAGKIGGTAAGLTGTALTAAGTEVAANDPSAGAWMSAGGNALQGASMGAAFGPWGMVIGGVLGALSGLPGIIKAMDSNNQRQFEYEQAKQKAEEAKITKAETKDEYNQVKNLLESYDKLKENRNNSEEDYQAWIDANNQLAEAYPQLISYIDAEGNAIVDVTNASTILGESMKKAARASEEYYRLKKLEYDAQIKMNEGYVYRDTVWDRGASEDLYKQLGLMDSSGKWLNEDYDDIGNFAALTFDETEISVKTITDAWEAQGVRQDYLLYAMQGSTEALSKLNKNERNWYDALNSGDFGLMDDMFTRNEDDEITGWETHLVNYLSGQTGEAELGSTKKQAFQDAIYWQNEAASVDDVLSGVSGSTAIIDKFLRSKGYNDSEQIDSEALTTEQYSALIKPLINAYDNLSSQSQQKLSGMYDNLDSYSHKQLKEEFKKYYGGADKSNPLWNAYAGLWMDQNYRSASQYGKALLGDRYKGQTYEEWLGDRDDSSANREAYYEQTLKDLGTVDPAIRDFIDSHASDTVEGYIDFLKSSEATVEAGGYAGFAAKKRMGFVEGIVKGLGEDGTYEDLSLGQTSELLDLLTSEDAGTQAWADALTEFEEKYGIEIADFDQYVFENFTTHLNSLTDGLDDSISDLDSLLDKQSKGLSFKEAVSYYKKYAKEGQSWDDFYTVTADGKLIFSDFRSVLDSASESMQVEYEAFAQNANKMIGILEESGDLNKEGSASAYFAKKVGLLNLDSTAETQEQVQGRLQVYFTSQGFTKEEASSLTSALMSSADMTTQKFIDYMENMVLTSEAAQKYWEQNKERLIQEQNKLNFKNAADNFTAALEGPFDAIEEGYKILSSAGIIGLDADNVGKLLASGLFKEEDFVFDEVSGTYSLSTAARESLSSLPPWIQNTIEGMIEGSVDSAKNEMTGLAGQLFGDKTSDATFASTFSHLQKTLKSSDIRRVATYALMQAVTGDTKNLTEMITREYAARAGVDEATAAVKFEDEIAETQEEMIANFKDSYVDQIKTYNNLVYKKITGSATAKELEQLDDLAVELNIDLEQFTGRLIDDLKLYAQAIVDNAYLSADEKNKYLKDTYDTIFGATAYAESYGVDANYLTKDAADAMGNLSAATKVQISSKNRMTQDQAATFAASIGNAVGLSPDIVTSMFEYNQDNATWSFDASVGKSARDLQMTALWQAGQQNTKVMEEFQNHSITSVEQLLVADANAMNAILQAAMASEDQQILGIMAGYEAFDMIADSTKRSKLFGGEARAKTYATAVEQFASGQEMTFEELVNLYSELGQPVNTDELYRLWLQGPEAVLNELMSLAETDTSLTAEQLSSVKAAKERGVTALLDSIASITDKAINGTATVDDLLTLAKNTGIDLSGKVIKTANGYGLNQTGMLAVAAARGRISGDYAGEAANLIEMYAGRGGTFGSSTGIDAAIARNESALNGIIQEAGELLDTEDKSLNEEEKARKKQYKLEKEQLEAEKEVLLASKDAYAKSAAKNAANFMNNDPYGGMGEDFANFLQSKYTAKEVLKEAYGNKGIISDYTQAGQFLEYIGYGQNWSPSKLMQSQNIMASYIKEDGSIDFVAGLKAIFPDWADLTPTEVLEKVTPYLDTSDQKVIGDHKQRIAANEEYLTKYDKIKADETQRVAGKTDGLIEIDEDGKNVLKIAEFNKTITDVYGDLGVTDKIIADIAKTRYGEDWKTELADPEAMTAFMKDFDSLVSTFEYDPTSTKTAQQQFEEHIKGESAAQEVEERLKQLEQHLNDLTTDEAAMRPLLDGLDKSIQKAQYLNSLLLEARLGHSYSTGVDSDGNYTGVIFTDKTNVNEQNGTDQYDKYKEQLAQTYGLTKSQMKYMKYDKDSEGNITGITYTPLIKQIEDAKAAEDYAWAQLEGMSSDDAGYDQLWQEAKKATKTREGLEADYASMPESDKGIGEQGFSYQFRDNKELNTTGVDPNGTIKYTGDFKEIDDWIAENKHIEAIYTLSTPDEAKNNLTEQLKKATEQEEYAWMAMEGMSSDDAGYDQLLQEAQAATAEVQRLQSELDGLNKRYPSPDDGTITLTINDIEAGEVTKSQAMTELTALQEAGKVTVSFIKDGKTLTPEELAALTPEESVQVAVSYDTKELSADEQQKILDSVNSLPIEGKNITITVADLDPTSSSNITKIATELAKLNIFPNGIKVEVTDDGNASQTLVDNLVDSLDSIEETYGTTITATVKYVDEKGRTLILDENGQWVVDTTASSENGTPPESSGEEGPPPQVYTIDDWYAAQERMSKAAPGTVAYSAANQEWTAIGQELIRQGDLTGEELFAIMGQLYVPSQEQKEGEPSLEPEPTYTLKDYIAAEREIFSTTRDTDPMSSEAVAAYEKSAKIFQALLDGGQFTEEDIALARQKDIVLNPELGKQAIAYLDTMMHDDTKDYRSYGTDHEELADLQEILSTAQRDSKEYAQAYARTLEIYHSYENDSFITPEAAKKELDTAVNAAYSEELEAQEDAKQLAWYQRGIELLERQEAGEQLSKQEKQEAKQYQELGLDQLKGQLPQVENQASQSRADADAAWDIVAGLEKKLLEAQVYEANLSRKLEESAWYFGGYETDYEQLNSDLESHNDLKSLRYLIDQMMRQDLNPEEVIESGSYNSESVVEAMLAVVKKAMTHPSWKTLTEDEQEQYLDLVTSVPTEFMEAVDLLNSLDETEQTMQDDLATKKKQVEELQVKKDQGTITAEESKTLTDLQTEVNTLETALEDLRAYRAVLQEVVLQAGNIPFMVDAQKALNTIDDLKKAIAKLPANINIYGTLTIPETPNGDGNTGDGKATGNVNGIALAKGNATSLIDGAKLANKTLVGELGPELGVWDGQYHLLGQHGAEFVNMPSDAIVFNHKQTKGIVNGQWGYRGKALAEGNISGSAYAGGHIFDPWGLQYESFADFVAGLGKGGKQVKATIAEDLEEWYNLLRKIAKLEAEISLIEAERANMLSGNEILRNYREQQALLHEQIATQKLLVEYQKEQLKLEADRIKQNEFWSKSLTFNEDGTLLSIFGNEANGGRGVFAFLDQLNELSGKQQVAMLEKLGYAYKDREGKSLEGEELVKQFITEYKEIVSHYNELDDSILSAESTIEGLITSINDLEQQIKDNQKKLEQSVYDILVEVAEREIEQIENQNALLKEANEKYVQGLTNALNKEQSLYEQNDAISNRESLQRQLSLLRRSGGSASEIEELERQLDETLKAEYFESQQKMIEDITKANENQVKLMENQVRLQKEALEYQKENGVIWTKVYEVMNGSYDSILSFFSGNSNEFFKASALEQESMLLEWAKIIGIYDENRASEQASKDAASHWNDGTINSMFAMDKTLSEYKDAQGNVKTKTREQIYNELSDEDKKAAQEHYNMAYTDAILQGKTMDEAKKAAYNSMVERLRVDSNLGQVYWDPHGEGSGNSNGSFGDGQQVTYYGGYTADGTFIGGSGRFAYGSAAIAKQIAQNNKILVDQEGNFKTGSSPIQPWRKWYIEDANGFRLSSSVYDLKEQAEKAIKDKIGLLTGKSKLGIAISDEEMKWSRAVAKFYSKGGLVDYTGLAMVHGSKSKPEAFLNAAQTAQIKEALEATNGKENLLQGLYSTISQLRSLIHSINTINNSNNYDVTIAPGAVVINVDQLADSYDVETLSADIMNRMVSIASKATNRGVNRR